VDEERHEGSDRSIFEILEPMTTGGVTVERIDPSRERVRASADDRPPRKQRPRRDDL
jgi:hypothetical protein